jgi:protein phosphatase
VKITSFGGTDTGKKRANNEDAYMLNDQLGLYAVADGVGGSEGGEVASRMAVETLAASVPDLLGDKESTPPGGLIRTVDPAFSALQLAITLSNRTIRQARAETPALSGMGTTLTSLLLRHGHAFIAHVGDSRAYLLRSGEFRQLTNDHSLVGEQVRHGVITREQARTSPYRHVITRALGIDEEVKIDLEKHPLLRGDRLLLCTDGLTEMVDDMEIGGILGGADPREAVRKLIDAANRAGGVDNITSVVILIAEV